MKDKKRKASGSLKLPRCWDCERVRRKIELVPADADLYLVVDVRDERSPTARFWGDWLTWKEDGKSIFMCPACASKFLPGWLAGKDMRTEEEKRLEKAAKAELDARFDEPAEEALRMIGANREGRDLFEATKALRAFVEAKLAEDEVGAAKDAS